MSGVTDAPFRRLVARLGAGLVVSEMVATDVRKFFGDKVYKTVIPRNVRVSEAPSHGLPAIVYDMRSPGAQAYIHLASEVLKRERSLGNGERVA